MPSRGPLTLVPIRSGGTEPPLFLLPGAGGNVIYFYKLAHELAPARPVYGLQAIGRKDQS